jgi:hypothetical protein
MMNAEGNDTRAELRKLNRLTFIAEERREVEGRGWREFLERCLAEDFVIRRARADLPNQNRQQMLDWIEQASPVERSVKEDEAVAWTSGELGAVACPVELVRDGGRHRYQNVKIFRKSPQGHWECVYWQVTEAPMSPVHAAT